MNCRYCRGRCIAVRVVQLNHAKETLRYRKCLGCGRRLRTIEVELSRMVENALDAIGKRFPAGLAPTGD